jgi:hypothetical protein
MKAQRKTTRRISAKDREFERLLRRAALYLKERAAENSRPRKRVAAA